MKPIFFLFLLFLAAGPFTAKAQGQLTLFGITDTFININRLNDSAANTNTPFIRVDKGVVVMSFLLLINPLPREDPFVTSIIGNRISPDIRRKLKSSIAGDRITISNVKVFRNGKVEMMPAAATFILQ